MVDIGVATSIAKKYNYSWDITAQFCEKHLLTAIQFYLSSNFEIPELSLPSTIGKRYLHLPADVYDNPEKYFSVCNRFRSLYQTDKLVLHQDCTFSPNDQVSIIREFNKQGFIVGIENENTKGLSNYLELLKLNISSGNKAFCVLDIHKFFNIFHKDCHLELIKDAITRILSYCKKYDINILLHIIDSKSFQGDRNHWRPMFKGIVPYTEIINYISEKAIDIDAVIFEYENESLVIESLENLKDNVIFFDKN